MISVSNRPFIKVSPTHKFPDIHFRNESFVVNYDEYEYSSIESLGFSDRSFSIYSNGKCKNYETYHDLSFNNVLPKNYTRLLEKTAEYRFDKIFAQFVKNKYIQIIAHEEVSTGNSVYLNIDGSIKRDLYRYTDKEISVYNNILTVRNRSVVYTS